jgi:hypothetical protein
MRCRAIIEVDDRFKQANDDRVRLGRASPPCELRQESGSVCRAERIAVGSSLQ